VHVFTHFELRLSIYRAKVRNDVKADDGWWEPVTNLDAQALPTVMKKAISQAIPLAFAARAEKTQQSSRSRKVS
jgi:A/G-specific adenine glycosylase